MYMFIIINKVKKILISRLTKWNVIVFLLLILICCLTFFTRFQVKLLEIAVFSLETNQKIPVFFSDFLDLVWEKLYFYNFFLFNLKFFFSFALPVDKAFFIGVVTGLFIVLFFLIKKTTTSVKYFFITFLLLFFICILLYINWDVQRQLELVEKMTNVHQIIQEIQTFSIQEQDINILYKLFQSSVNKIYNSDLFVFNKNSSLIFEEYFPIMLFTIIAITLSVIIVLFSYLLTNQKPETEKLSMYECGFEPYEDARNFFDVKFCLVGILFIIFDIETMFLFPWTISLSQLNLLGFWSMIDFIIELGIGIIYVWYIGALDWD